MVAYRNKSITKLDLYDGVPAIMLDYIDHDQESIDFTLGRIYEAADRGLDEYLFGADSYLMPENTKLMEYKEEWIRLRKQMSRDHNFSF